MKRTGARQYAEALYNLAKEENVIDDYIALSHAIINIANENPLIFNYISSNNISYSEKKKFIKELSEEYEYYEN